MEEERKMRQYELNCFLNPNLSEEEILNLSQKISNFIKESEGQIEMINEPKIKKLSFPIKKFHQGYFLEIKFLTDPQRTSELEKKLKLEEKILRFSILTVPPITQKPEKPAKKAKIYPSEKEKTGKEREEKIEAEKIKPQKTEIKKEKVRLEDIDEKLKEIIGDI